MVILGSIALFHNCHNNYRIWKYRAANRYFISHFNFDTTNIYCLKYFSTTFTLIKLLDWGKIVTILYAIIGIPLMLFCLSNIGHAMAHSFKFIYWKCCCYLCVQPKRHRRRSGKRRSVRRTKVKVTEQIELQTFTTSTTASQLYPYNNQTNWRSSRYSNELDSTPIICNKYALNDELIEPSPGFPGIQ